MVHQTINYPNLKKITRIVSFICFMYTCSYERKDGSELFIGNINSFLIGFGITFNACKEIIPWKYILRKEIVDIYLPNELLLFVSSSSRS